MRSDAPVRGVMNLSFPIDPLIDTPEYRLKQNEISYRSLVGYAEFVQEVNAAGGMNEWHRKNMLRVD